MFRFVLVFLGHKLMTRQKLSYALDKKHGQSAPFYFPQAQTIIQM